MFNRILAIIVAVILVGSFLRIEQRITQLERKVDSIIQTDEQVKYTPKDVECLTKNIYYEAGVENKTGKYAVAHVTVNRVKAGKWGNNVCKVVYAKKQFSWTNQTHLPKPNKQLWAESKNIAVDVLNGARVNGLERSLYYHAVYIKQPKWADSNEHAMTIGQHKFYNRAKNSNVYI